METEIPQMLQWRMAAIPDETFTFHSSRMRMRHVNPDELVRMDADSDRCAAELADAACDVMAYACLVAIMCHSPRYHEEAEPRLTKVASADRPTRVVSSAGALIEALRVLGLKRIAMITPYRKPLTAQVADYIREYGFTVTEAVSLEVENNLEVGRLDPMNLLNIAEGLDRSQVDGLVLSACVQMPSLPAIQAAEDRFGLPVISAATSTVYRILKTLELRTYVPGAGRLLSGAY